MTDEYQNAVHKLMDYLSDTVIFAQAQLPDVANEILVYGAEMAHMWMVGWIVAASISSVIFLLLTCSFLKDSDFGVAIFCFFVISIALWIGAGIQYGIVREIRDAPKLYIMEQLKPMVQ